ncbi:hypothetical protein ACWCXH_29280 [Kitasatospora sp. NPDC001660]
MTTEDGSDLVAAVVEALVQSASHTVGAAGAALGGEAVARVREALRQWPQWAQALSRVEAAPGDQQAQRDLALAVGQLLGRDAGLTASLRARLSVATTEPPPGAGTPVRQLGGDAQASGPSASGDAPNWPAPGANWPAPGAGTGTAPRRRGIGLMVGVLVVIAALIALGIHLNSGQPQRLGGAGGPFGAAPLAGVAQVRSVLPDLHAVPAGWREDRAPTAEPPKDCHADDTSAAEADVCSQTIGTGVVGFRADNGNTRVMFRVIAGPSPAWADRTYDLAGSAGSSDSTSEPVPVAAVGDRSTAYRSGRYTSVVIKAGTTVLLLSYQPQSSDSPDAELVTRLARMFAARSQQAQSGRTPDAATQ